MIGKISGVLFTLCMLLFKEYLDPFSQLRRLYEALQVILAQKGISNISYLSMKYCCLEASMTTSEIEVMTKLLGSDLDRKSIHISRSRCLKN